MKIKVTEEELTRAIERFIGIEIILDTVEEARKALGLILEKTEASKRGDYQGLKEMDITQKVEHTTTAMEHKNVYVIEFVIENDSFLPMEIALIKELQRIFQQTRS